MIRKFSVFLSLVGILFCNVGFSDLNNCSDEHLMKIAAEKFSKQLGFPVDPKKFDCPIRCGEILGANCMQQDFILKLGLVTMVYNLVALGSVGTNEVITQAPAQLINCSGGAKGDPEPLNLSRSIHSPSITPCGEPPSGYSKPILTSKGYYMSIYGLVDKDGHSAETAYDWAFCSDGEWRHAWGGDGLGDVCK